MARQRSKKIVEGRKANPEAAKPQKPAPEDREFSDSDESEVMDEDDDENELARMVLGDSAGFDTNLGEDYEEDDDNEADVFGHENDEEDQGLEGVDDADVSTNEKLSGQLGLIVNLALLPRCRTICS